MHVHIGKKYTNRSLNLIIHLDLHLHSRYIWQSSMEFTVLYQKEPVSLNGFLLDVYITFAHQTFLFKTLIAKGSKVLQFTYYKKHK